MTDRLTNIIVGLQRTAEEARIRGDDIRYSQQQEDLAHLKGLKELLTAIQRIHSAVIDAVRKFEPPDQAAAQAQFNPPSKTVGLGPESDKPVPKFLQQGPRKENTG
jgi:hypothetical protein